jgi:hypothetical protein
VNRWAIGSLRILDTAGYSRVVIIPIAKIGMKYLFISEVEGQKVYEKPDIAPIDNNPKRNRVPN